jgi:hypothetical protein
MIITQNQLLTLENDALGKPCGNASLTLVLLRPFSKFLLELPPKTCCKSNKPCPFVLSQTTLPCPCDHSCLSLFCLSYAGLALLFISTGARDLGWPERWCWCRFKLAVVLEQGLWDYTKPHAAQGGSTVHHLPLRAACLPVSDQLFAWVISLTRTRGNLEYKSAYIFLLWKCRHQTILCVTLEMKGVTGCWWLTPVILATHKDHGLKQAWANSSMRPYLKKNHSTGGMAQGEGPEF